MCIVKPNDEVALVRLNVPLNSLVEVALVVAFVEIIRVPSWQISDRIAISARRGTNV